MRGTSETLRMFCGLAVFAFLPFLAQTNPDSLSKFSEAANLAYLHIAKNGLADPKAYLDKEACEKRVALLKLKEEGPAKEISRMFVLMDLGICGLLSDDFKEAKQRFDAAIEEIEAPDAMLDVDLFNHHIFKTENDPKLASAMSVNMRYAPLVSYKEAADHLRDGEHALAARALRRNKLLVLHEEQTMYAALAKGNMLKAEEVPGMINELSKKRQLSLKDLDLLSFAARFRGYNVAIEYLLQTLDDAIIGKDKLMLAKRESLKASKTGRYIPGLSMTAIAGVERLDVGQKLQQGASAVGHELLEANINSHQMLLKRARKGFSCGRLPKSCELMLGLSDLWTNGFGKTMVLELKAGQTYDYSTCETNANLAVIIPFSSSVVAATNGISQEVEKDTAAVIDFCLPWQFTSKTGAWLLVAQAWHPLVESLERIGETFEWAESWELEPPEVSMLGQALRHGGDEAAVFWATGKKPSHKSEL